MERVYTAYHENCAMYITYLTGLKPIYTRDENRQKWEYEYSPELLDYNREYYDMLHGKCDINVDLNRLLDAKKIVEDVREEYYRKIRATR